MENLEPILKLIERYGITTFALVVLAIFILPKANMVWKDYMDSKYSKELAIKQQKNVNVDTLLKFDMSVKALLTELRLDLQADWVLLWQFHNGVYSLGMPHIPFLSMSITHESHSDDVLPMGLVYNSVPTTYFREAGDKFIDNDIVITSPTAKSGDVIVPFAYGGLSNALLPIRDSEGHLAALMLVGFQAAHIFDDKSITEMKGYANRVAIYLATALREAGTGGEPKTEKTSPLEIKRAILSKFLGDYKKTT